MMSSFSSPVSPPGGSFFVGMVGVWLLVLAVCWWRGREPWATGVLLLVGVVPFLLPLTYCLWSVMVLASSGWSGAGLPDASEFWDRMKHSVTVGSWTAGGLVGLTMARAAWLARRGAGGSPGQT